MRSVVVLALIGLIGLVIATVTGSTPLAVVVIALAVAGIIQLVRDWRREPTPAEDPAPAAPDADPAPKTTGFTADDFMPDISTDPDGPSSNARADQN